MHTLNENGNALPSSSVSGTAGDAGRSSWFEAGGTFAVEVHADETVEHTVLIYEEADPSGRNKGTIDYVGASCPPRAGPLRAERGACVHCASCSLSGFADWLGNGVGVKAVSLILPDGRLESAQTEGGVARAAAYCLSSDPVHKSIVVECEDLIHREPVGRYLIQDHASRRLTDDVALTGKGEGVHAPLLPGLQVDHD